MRQVWLFGLVERPIRFEWAPSAPVADAKVRVCDPSDRDCTSPVNEKTTNRDGYACLDFTSAPEAGFRGYLEVTHPGAIPMLSYQAAPISRSRAVDWRPMFPTKLLDQVEALLGHRTAPSKGHVLWWHPIARRFVDAECP